MVMACRWGWTSHPQLPDPQFATAPSADHTPVSSFNNVRSKRFAPCQGRLYHQLSCSHRIRTDLVEDCGANCTEPFGSDLGAAFICNECLQGEASKILKERQAQHNANWPPINAMSQEQYDQWYAERRQLEDQFHRDFAAYETELKSKTRPSHICSVLDATKEEMDFVNEIDSLSLSLMTSNEDPNSQAQSPQSRTRRSLPTDASEQLHWNLNTLALDRGSCGVEYTAPPSNGMSAFQKINDEELWHKPRERD